MERAPRKTCTKCGVEKPLEEFYRRKANKDGRNSWCMLCHADATVAWRKANPELLKAHGDARRRRSPGESTKYVAAARKRDPLMNRRYVYGVTNDELEQMLIAQDGRCALCPRDIAFDHPRRSRRPNVDHDHSTGKIRGLLCLPCNTGIGLLQDSPSLLEKAAAYLRKHAYALDETGAQSAHSAAIEQGTGAVH